MFIIWGWRSRQIVKAIGLFFCPTCDQQRSYRHIQIKNFFTLYFIPLFPTSLLGEYVECQGCRQTFNTEVFKYEPPTMANRVWAVILTDLQSGMPLEMVVQKLTNAGIENDLACQVAYAAVAGQALMCRRCDVHYLSVVERCTMCGGPTEGLESPTPHLATPEPGLLTVTR